MANKSFQDYLEKRLDKDEIVEIEKLVELEMKNLEKKESRLDN